ncbi:MAG: ArsR/SmtB family transcription factor [Candidatus Limnocylindrales bacterium]
MTADHQAKLALNEQFARVVKALANARRIELLDLLAQAPRGVDALAVEAEMSIALTSSHRQVLRGAGLVAARREAQRIVYRLAGDDVYGLLASVRSLAHSHLADVERAADEYRGVSGEPEPMRREDLWRRAQAGDVVILDLRPKVEYDAGHIPGAVSIPLDELEERLAEIPADREIVAYCRGPYCVLAPRGVEILGASGYAARRLEDGLPEWRIAGYPTDGTADRRSAVSPGRRAFTPCPPSDAPSAGRCGAGLCP